MGKSTISMVIFNSYVSHYQRVRFCFHGFAMCFTNVAPVSQKMMVLKRAKLVTCGGMIDDVAIELGYFLVYRIAFIIKRVGYMLVIVGL